MDSFNKKISELYNQEQSLEHLPDDFGWDEMSDGIYEKMEEPKKKRKFFWMWFTFGSSAVLVAILFLYFNNDSKNNQVSSTNTLTEIAETKKEINPNLLKEHTIENQEPISTKLETQDTAPDRQVSSEKPVGFSNTTPTNSATKKTTNKAFEFSEKNQKFNAPNSTQKAKKFELKKPTELITKPGSTLPITSPMAKAPIPSSKALFFLPILKIELTPEYPAIPQTTIIRSQAVQAKSERKDAPSNIPKDKIKLAKNFQPHIYGGTLLTSGIYSGHQKRNQHSRWLPGYYTGIEFTVLEYKKWTLNLSYEHKFSVQLFDFQNITDTITNVLVENVLTGITTNSLNGSTSENHEDIYTRAVRQRNYLHYNTFRSHALKLTIEKSFDLSNHWQLMTRIGGSYNLLNLTKGRTIGLDGDTLNYDKNNLIYQKQNWGIEGGFSLAYRIGKVSLRGNLWVEKALNYSNESGTEMRPVFYKIGLGISRRF